LRTGASAPQERGFVRWVIGDIHGMLRPLEALLREIDRHDRAPRLSFAGDYIDRGPDSRGVVDLVLSLPNARCVRGNHDDLFDLLLNGHCEADPSGLTDSATYLADFVESYMAETLASYGVDAERVVRALYGPRPSSAAALLEPIPAAHRRFFRDLPLAAEDDDAFVTHAKLHPDEPDCSDDGPTLAGKAGGSAALRLDLVWGRFTEAEIRRPKRWRRTGYFGHTPVQALGGWRFVGTDPIPVPIRGPQIVLLDTGVALPFGGRLTAVCVEDGSFLQVDQDGAVVGAE
jgi:hypothetical protein